MDHSALNNSLILLCLSVLAVWAIRRIRFPSILGYLFVGILVGPYTLNWLPEDNTTQLLAEIGIVFLLFMIGLEFSVSRLLSMKGTVFGLGSAQVFISSVSGGSIVWLLGVDWQPALIVGGALALSSTAIVAKQLTEQLELQGRHGQLAIGILLFQDLAVVPLLVIIPILANGDSFSPGVPILIALLKGVFAFIIMYLAGRRLLRPFFHLLASTRSAELFTLGTLLVALTAAWLTHILGLSLALGAFLAGIMLSETEYRQQIAIDIRPFRDVLIGLFFITVGTQFNWRILILEWDWILLLTSGLIIGKGAVIAVLARLSGYEQQVALRTGLILAQGGEFSFAVLLVAIGNGLITLEQNQPIIASIIMSMMIAPLLIYGNRHIARYVFGDNNHQRHPVTTDKPLVQAAHHFSHHLIICGFGRIGQNLAVFLRDQGMPYIALDLDQTLIKNAWEAGEPIFYGDSGHRTVMQQAGLERATVVVITFDQIDSAMQIISTVRAVNHDIPIIVRSHSDTHMDQLLKAGATNIIPESFEASMMLATHVLCHLGMTKKQAVHFVAQARDDEYRRLRGFFHGEKPEDKEL